jgi:hypothetical protein
VDFVAHDRDTPLWPWLLAEHPAGPPFMGIESGLFLPSRDADDADVSEIVESLNDLPVSAKTIRVVPATNAPRHFRAGRGPDRRGPRRHR